MCQRVTLGINFGCHFCQSFYVVVRLADALDLDVVLGGEHAGTGACGRADGERERRGRPVDHAACHELQDDVAVVIDVALLDVVEETVLPFVSFQKRMMLYSVSLVAVASRSAMAWRMEPTVSGEMLSFSVSTRNAEIRDVSCWMSIIIFADFQFSAKVE